MTGEIFRSDRRFVLWDASAGLGRVLFRSLKNNNSPFNLDMIFFDSHFLQVKNILEGVVVNIAERDDLVKYSDVNKFLSYPDSVLFSLESEGEFYFIAASFVKVFENEFDFGETSLKSPSADCGIEIASSK